MRDIKFTKSIAFRISSQTEQELAAIAACNGISIGELARELVLGGIGRAAEAPAPRRHVPNADALRDILGQLGRHGASLNQIAKAMNTRGATPEAQASLARMTIAYMAAVDALRTTLGIRKSP